MVDHAAPAPDLTIRCGPVVRTFEAARVRPVVIGRGEHTDLRIDDPRISRAHVRIEVDDGHWQVIDNDSRNGFYIDGTRRRSAPITEGLTIALGNPAGVAVSFHLEDEGAAATATISGEEGPTALLAAPELLDEGQGNGGEDREIDPGIARAGAAVAARRRELEITQRGLARDGLINAASLIAFEKGRRWPREQNRARLEDILRWPRGTIDRIRNGEAPPGNDELTELLTDSQGAPLILQAISAGLHAAATAISALPPPERPEFAVNAAKILADLRQLETVTTHAAPGAKSNPEFVLALSTVRRLYADLMTRAAESPYATVGQRLFAARRQAALTVDDVAAATGLPVETIDAAEAGRMVSADATDAIEAFMSRLQPTWGRR
ncbi:FHA domain-containing protein [uncultured Mycobacterium sp.]|uniref:FHA domain-containing protein n=1 Tax=uncultured Mycobacterium sp. TaxID=171292 RepID=UPI0035C9BE34